MIELMMCKLGDTLKAVSESDAELMQKLKPAASYRVQVYAQSDRSLQHHRLFYGGLVRLAMQYYEQPSGVITPAEKQVVLSFAKYLGQHSNSEDALNNAARLFLHELSSLRLSKVTPPPVTIESFVKWLKIQAGHFDYESSPDGSVRKVPKSINFNSMSQEEFKAFYRDCFSVVWKLVLSRHFDSEEECQNIIDQLVSMG